jgi:hypothetical protein
MLITPQYSIVPISRKVSPNIDLIKVDFPEPELPTIAMNSPCLILMSKATENYF